MKSIAKARASSAPVFRMTAPLRLFAAALLTLSVLLPAAAQAQCVSLAAMDAAYTQDFDTLSNTAGTTTNALTIPGWFMKETGTAARVNQQYAVDTGASNTGDTYSYGAAGSTDRALGSLFSGTLTPTYGACFSNDTGSTITSLDVAYVGEEWRLGTAGRQDKLQFVYSLDATDLSTGNWTGVAALDFATPDTSAPLNAKNGNDPAERTALSATIDSLSIAPGATFWVRWIDTDATGADDGLAVDDFSLTPRGSGGPGVPAISIDSPSVLEGASGTTATLAFHLHLSAVSADEVTFDIATTGGTATEGTDYVAQSLTGQSIPAGQQDYTFNVTVNGDDDVEADETVVVSVTNIAGATPASLTGTGTILNDDVAPPTVVKIHDVQGSVVGTTPGTISGCGSGNDGSPLCGQTVTVEAIVTATFPAFAAGQLGGFNLQEEDLDADDDPTTSEGIFIYCPSCTGIKEGDRVRVTGTVGERFGMTQISAFPAGVVVTEGTINHLSEVTPAHITLPIADGVDINAYYEAREGMLVEFDELTVSEYFQLFRYGQITLVAGDRPRTFTEDNAPSVAGLAAHLDALARRQVILDDDRDGDEAVLNDPVGEQAAYWPHLNGGFSLGTQGLDFFRGGDKVPHLVGVLQWSRPGSIGSPANTWRVRPSNSYPVAFTAVNLRPQTPPDVGGSIRVVGMNLLNYFTTIDTTAGSSGPCGPGHTLDCRGADSQAELVRQTTRAAKVICDLNPDVAAFMEMENNNQPTPTTTIQYLLDAVNQSCGGAHQYTYQNNSGGTLGTDAIRVMIVYRSGIVAPFGPALVDNDPIHNRPPMAQTFDVVDAANPAVGKRFTVVANHLKSKGSCPTSGPDADQNDGQGCWAATRTDQATRLLEWLEQAGIMSDSDGNVLLLGDFNSYASETPITTLKNSAIRFHDMESELHGTGAYSYLFNGELGHLDYALASEPLASQITGADAWHINADEVDLFDYNDDIKDTGEAAYEQKPNGSALSPARTLWDPNLAIRASDHDPVVVGLFTRSNVSVSIEGAPDPVIAGSNITYTITVTNEGPDPANVNWHDALPPGTNLVTYTGGGPEWGCGGNAAPSPQVGCGNDAMEPGTEVFTVVASVDSDLPSGTIITNSVSLNPDHDTDPSDNTASKSITVAGAPQGQLTITPTALAFGDQAVGTTSVEKTVTLKNEGTASLDVTALTAATGPFARTSGGTCTGSSFTLAVNASCTLTYTFTPTVTGAATQTLTVTVTANAPGSGTIALSGTGVQGHLSITPTSVSFGNQVVGSTSAAQTVTLKNDGTASLDVTALTAATGPFARTAGGTCTGSSFTLAVNASCTLTYTFTPTGTGAASQTLTVTANAPGDSTIVLQGTGVQGHLSINPTGVNFGNQIVGSTSAAATVTLKNEGTASLDVTALTAATSPFARTSGGTCTGSSFTLAVNASCTLTYTFTPTGTGAASQTLTVTTSAPGDTTIVLQGTGVQGHLSINPTSVNFGNQTVGSTSAPQTVTLTNDGNAALNVTALTTAVAPFARAGGTCGTTLPIALAANASCTLAYTFTPTITGAATQTLIVTANAPGSGTIALSGTGTIPQVADVAVTLGHAPAYAQIGDTIDYVITVKNASGPATASVTVSDALPTGLGDGSWVCTPSGAATCASGSGNTLADNATLPSGTQVSYLYSATVQSGAPDFIVNHVDAQVTGSVSDPNPANNSADDTATIVIFRDGFEADGATLDLAPYADGKGFVSAMLSVDGALLDGVGIMPVAIASGRTDDGRVAFTLEVARFGASYSLRLTMIGPDGVRARGAWQAAGLGQPLDFAWQSAAVDRADGYLRLVAGAATLQSSGRDNRHRLIELRIPVGADAAPSIRAR